MSAPQAMLRSSRRAGSPCRGGGDGGDDSSARRRAAEDDAVDEQAMAGALAQGYDEGAATS